MRIGAPYSKTGPRLAQDQCKDSLAMLVLENDKPHADRKILHSHSGKCVEHTDRWVVDHTSASVWSDRLLVVNQLRIAGCSITLQQVYVQSHSW